MLFYRPLPLRDELRNGMDFILQHYQALEFQPTNDGGSEAVALIDYDFVEQADGAAPSYQASAKESSNDYIPTTDRGS